MREPRFRCLTCRDTGWAECWSKVSMQAVRDGTLGKPGTLARTAICCSCDRGKNISEHSVKRDYDRKWDVYNAKVWLLLVRTEDGKHVVGSISDPAEQDRLREFMANFGERYMESKEFDFDAPVHFPKAET